MAERERRITPPYGGVFHARTRVMSPEDIQRAVWRMAHEIIEHNHGLDGVALIGLQTGGVPLAGLLADDLHQIEQVDIPLGTLDVAFYRDDIGLRTVTPVGATEIPVDISGRVVVLVDDVLFTGRTVRAALDALTELGRPRAVQLAVLIDRGHRELPIRPDYVGKNLPTGRTEDVRVRLAEVDGGDDGIELWDAHDEGVGEGIG
jgi:pyrimidine operon attenuation protein/uracil phosphoribosyltransferase